MVLILNRNGLSRLKLLLIGLGVIVVVGGLFIFSYSKRAVRGRLSAEGWKQHCQNEIFPNHSKVDFYTVANCYRAFGKYQEAIEYHKKALEDPRTTHMLYFTNYFLCDSYFKIGNLAEAKNYCRKAIESGKSPIAGYDANELMKRINEAQ